ncbi:MAG: error-prone DNA polymerase, partial [Actinobacteria bacterium]|nr:error-prone DNA polymerase [Actinomycetota bacterium]
DALEALAMAGAFAGCSDLDRRSALWAAGALRDARPDTLPGLVGGAEAPTLPGMSGADELAADLWSMGLSPGHHPIALVRAVLDERGVVAIENLRGREHRSVIEVAGIVTHRQRPATAKGVIFINLEDETGLLNVICTPGVWRRYRQVGRTSGALIVRGVLERRQGVTNLRAVRLLPLPGGSALRSRDFR